MTQRKYLLIFGLLFSVNAFANNVEIVRVVLSKYAGSWRADVTLRHADEGWKHYADAWRLVDDKGNEIAKRVLWHPHVNEQPFTRSLSNFHLSENIKILYVEAHDKKHGWSPDRVKIDMTRAEGSRYKITIR